MVAFTGSLLGLKNHYSIHMWSAFPQRPCTRFIALQQTGQRADAPSPFCLVFNKAVAVREFKRHVRGRLGSLVSLCHFIAAVFKNHWYTPSKLVICLICFVGDPHVDKVLRLQLWQSNREFFMEVRSSVWYYLLYRSYSKTNKYVLDGVCNV